MREREPAGVRRLSSAPGRLLASWSPLPQRAAPRRRQLASEQAEAPPGEAMELDAGKEREAAYAAFAILDFAAKVQGAAEAADGVIEPGTAARGDFEAGTDTDGATDAESDDELYMA